MFGEHPRAARATSRGQRRRDLEEARVIDGVVAEARSVATVFGDDVAQLRWCDLEPGRNDIASTDVEVVTVSGPWPAFCTVG